MIVDKKNKQIISGNAPSISAPPPQESKPQEEVKVPVQVSPNGPIDVLNAIMEILKACKWEYGVAGSSNIFKTVQIADGQYERIISPSGNHEETIGFPAAFVHFIDWHYLVQQNRINEGRATLRIRFIMNRLNNHDRGDDTEVYYVAERINQDIQESVSKYECLQERCQLQYIDPMESFDNALQPCWMTYEIWFRQTNVWVLRNKIYKNFVFPPFANHADQDTGIAGVNPEHHNNLDHPERYDDKTGFIS